MAIVGHCNPAVVAAIQRQAETLITCPEVFYSDVRAKLLERLLSIAPAGLERAYLCNSGTESVEAALKLARLCTGRSEIVAMKRGFHGRTMGALSATWEPKYREPFMPLVPGFTHVTYGDLDALSAAVNDETAAVLLEVVQGEGGVNVGSGDYLRGVQALCAERGALLIVDEVQTGFGRTGKLFACRTTICAPTSSVLPRGWRVVCPWERCSSVHASASLHRASMGRRSAAIPWRVRRRWQPSTICSRTTCLARRRRRGRGLCNAWRGSRRASSARCAAWD